MFKKITSAEFFTQGSELIEDALSETHDPLFPNAALGDYFFDRMRVEGTRLRRTELINYKIAAVIADSSDPRGEEIRVRGLVEVKEQLKLISMLYQSHKLRGKCIFHYKNRREDTGNDYV